MVHEAPSVDVTQLGVSCPVETLQEEGFDDELFEQKQDDEDDGEDEARVGGQFGEKGQRDVFDVFVAAGMEQVGIEFGHGAGGYVAGRWICKNGEVKSAIFVLVP